MKDTQEKNSFKTVNGASWPQNQTARVIFTIWQKI